MATGGPQGIHPAAKVYIIVERPRRPVKVGRRLDVDNVLSETADAPVC
jgi:hypothetical protein